MPADPQDLNRPPPAGAPDPLAAALARLEPAAADLNRDRLMFAAGAESRRPVIRLWMLTAGFLAAMGFAAGMLVRPAQVVYVERPGTPAAAPTRGPLPAEPVAAPAEQFPPRPAEGRDSPTPPAPRQAFFTQPPSADAVRWLQVRNDVLSAGLGMLPDAGRNARPGDRITAPGEFWAHPKQPVPAPPKKPEPDGDPD